MRFCAKETLYREEKQKSQERRFVGEKGMRKVRAMKAKAICTEDKSIQGRTKEDTVQVSGEVVGMHDLLRHLEADGNFQAESHGDDFSSANTGVDNKCKKRDQGIWLWR